MKKRLLSAALALAMVLTLLPWTAMPASAAMVNGDAVVYKDREDNEVKGSDFRGAGWYVKHVEKVGNTTSTTYEKISNGFVINNKYYSGWVTDEKTGKPLSTTNIIAIGSAGTAFLGDSTSVSIEVYGAGSSVTINGDKLTSITVKDSKYKTEVEAGIRLATDRGSVSFSGGMAEQLTKIDLSDVDGSGISVNLPSGNVGRTVTLTNARIGGITMSSDVDGKHQSAQNIDTKQSNVKPPIGVVPGNEITGPISLTGNSSKITLWDTELGANTISLTGTGSQLQANGATNGTGAITLCGSNISTVTTGTAPTVTVNGTSLGPISAAAYEQLTSNYKVEVNTQARVAGINIPNVDITLKSGYVGTSGVQMTNGSLKLQDASRIEGAVQFQNGANDTAGIIKEFSVSGGNNRIDGAVTTGTKVTFTTVKIPNEITNKFVSMDLGNYGGKGIAGGSFKTVIPVAHKAYLSDDLAYEVKLPLEGSNQYYAYFSKNQLSQAIAAAGSTNAVADDGILLVGQTKGAQITLSVGTQVMAKIGFNTVPSSIILPGIVNGADYVTWTLTHDSTNPGTSYNTGETFTRSEVADIELNAQAVSGVATKITNATNVTTSNDDVKVTMVGNTITLSGAATSVVGGNAGFDIKLDTDIVDGSGNLVTVNIFVNWNSQTGKATFARDREIRYGITFPDENTLRLNNGTTYTVNGSGLKELVTDNFDYDRTVGKVEVVVNASGYTSNLQKQQLIDRLLGATPGTTSYLDWTNSPAVRQAINAAMATVSASQVNNWITSAQRTAWGKTSKVSPTAADLAGTGYNTAYLVPYLYMNVTKSEQNNALTATLTVYYRIVVRGGSYGDIEVQVGRALGALASDLTNGNGSGGIDLLLAATGAYDNNIYAWQDDTYVYPVGADGKVKFTHSGRSGNGLGNVVFNSVSPTVELLRGGVHYAYYNSLQAAVDDTKPQPEGSEDKINVYGTYTGSGAITMSGAARKIQIETFGNTTITSNTKDVVTTAPATGHVYTVQLLQGTVVTGNVTVASVNGGSATVSSNSVKSGDVVTVTLVAAQGYLPNGVTVTTNTGARISTTGSGTSYTFTVPYSSFTSITVTPSFRLNTGSNGTTAVYVQNSLYGSATTTASNGMTVPGSSVGVTVVPYNGYRATGVTVTTNVGTLSATRVSENYYTFTVPANATTVTITPNFSATTTTTTTQFVDVPAGQYYTNAVAWASSQGITQGTTTTSFSPGITITRAQMVTFLWRAAGKPTVSTLSTQYVDVTATMDRDYYNAIQWAIANGITKGVDSTHFGPSQTVNRAQAVTFLWRYEGSPVSSGNGFPDVPAGDFASAVRWAVNKQPCAITAGVGNNQFAPNNPVTRGEAVTFLYRDKTGNFQ